VPGRSDGGLRGYVLRALTEIRRAQVRIRIARSRLEALNDIEGAVRLEALNEVLERIALRLETILVLSTASPELLRALVTAGRALEPLQHHAPPDIKQMIVEVQETLDKIQNTLTPVEPVVSNPSIGDEAEEVLREAMEVARRKVTMQWGKTDKPRRDL